MPKSILVLTLPLALLAGCGGDSDNHGDIDAEGCEHLTGPTSSSVTATSAPPGPAVSADHRRYDVTLVDIAGGNGGFVTFAAVERGDYVLFFDADIPLAITTTQDVGVTISGASDSSPACAEVRKRYTVPLEIGGYYLLLGPTTATSVGLVIERDE
jgi:hypothetical protein